MPSFDEFPTEFADLNEFFPELSSKVGLSHEQVRAIVENIYWNYNHLSQADIEIGTVTVNYAPAGTPFDVEITHSGEYDDHGCLIKDILNFTFTIAVAKVTTTASATLGQTSSDIGAVVTETERQDHTGYDLDFAFTIPRGLQGVQGASFRNKGTYDSTQIYVNNGTYIDFVSYEGSLYAPTVIQTTAGVLPTNTSQWSLMVRRGNGITSITKTSTSGAVDTYTITFEDGTTTTFEVTNGTTPDVSGKADKVANATTGNIATLDGNGNLADGGVAPAGLQSLIDSAHKLAADLVDDTSTTNKFVTSTDITAWNGNTSAISGILDGTNIDSFGDVESALTGKQDVLQYSTMPTASASNVGAIVQYTGADTNDYISGHFYKCVDYGGNYGYGWEEVMSQYRVSLLVRHGATSNVSKDVLIDTTRSFSGLPIDATPTILVGGQTILTRRGLYTHDSSTAKAVNGFGYTTTIVDASHTIFNDWGYYARNINDDLKQVVAFNKLTMFSTGDEILTRITNNELLDGQVILCIADSTDNPVSYPSLYGRL